MSAVQQVPLDQALLDYLVRHSSSLPDGVERAWEQARELERSSMQISPDQAVLVRLLLRAVGAERVLEIGTFLGLSALVMAEAVGPEGRIVCLDRSEEWTAEARKLWEEGGVSERIELHLGDAHETVRTLEGSFDAVLIDADKSGYLDYLDQVTPRLRPGGLLLVDNTLWYGKVTDPGDISTDTEAIREFNRVLADHSDYEVAVVAVGDGLSVALRR
ncbi:MAG TPA: O-methyltransferase [Acidimicrobiia bacterium]|nr:O-methyltransferase [Acidimicrobiia bacterium]